MNKYLEDYLAKHTIIMEQQPEGSKKYPATFYPEGSQLPSLEDLVAIQKSLMVGIIAIDSVDTIPRFFLEIWDEFGVPIELSYRYIQNMGKIPEQQYFDTLADVVWGEVFQSLAIPEKKSLFSRPTVF